MPDSQATTVTFSRILRFLHLPMSLIPALALVAGIVQARRGWPVGFHDWLAIGAMVILSMAIFADNGYHDRQIDLKKGQPFALEHPALARRIGFYLYTVSVILAAFVGITVALYFFLLALASMVYSAWAVKIPGLKNLMAAAVSASFLLLGGTIAGHLTTVHWVSAVAILLVITAQEIIKDVEDVTADQGWRRTLPMLWSTTRLRTAVWALIISGLAVTWLVRTQTIWFWASFGMATTCFIMAAASFSRGDIQRGGRIGRRWMYAGLWFGVMALTAAAWH